MVNELAIPHEDTNADVVTKLQTRCRSKQRDYTGPDLTTALILLKRMPRVFYLSLAPSALQNHWPPIYCICLLSCRKIFMFCPGLFVFIWLLSSAQILITLIKSWSNQKNSLLQM